MQKEQMKLGYHENVTGKSIPIMAPNHVPEEHIKKLEKCKKFNDYLLKIKQAPKHVQVQAIVITFIYLFRTNQIGFITLKLQSTINGKQFEEEQNFAFIRGESVAILLFANDKLVLVQQYRVASQRTCLEPPAGMMDQSGNVVGQMIKEVQEETGIHVHQKNLTYMGSMIASPQSSDQEMHLFLCKTHLSEQKIKYILEKIHGQIDSNQKIRVVLKDYDPNLILSTGNNAFICLAAAYEAKFKNSKQI